MRGRNSAWIAKGCPDDREPPRKQGLSVQRYITYDRLIVTVVGLLAILALASLVRAALGPKIQVSDEILLAVAPDRTWSYVTEDDRRILWETGIISIVPLDVKEFGPGAKNLLIYAIDGGTFEVEETILEAADGKFVTAREGKDFKSSWRVVVEPSGTGRTRVSIEQIRRPKRFRLKWLAPWLQWQDSRRLRRALSNLSDIISEAP